MSMPLCTVRIHPTQSIIADFKIKTVWPNQLSIDSNNRSDSEDLVIVLVINLKDDIDVYMNQDIVAVLEVESNLVSGRQEVALEAKAVLDIAIDAAG